MRSRRTIELLLLLAAAPVVLLAFALVHGAARDTVTFSDLAVPAGLLATFVVAHLAVRRFAPGADPVLLPVTALLSGVGLAVITRLDPRLAGSQLVWLLVGLAVFAATLGGVPSLERLARYKYTIALAGIVLLLLPAVAGREVNGAKLWLRFGGYSFQPAEVAKVLIVLFLAAYLAENREVLSVSTRRVLGLWLPPARQLGPLLTMWAVSLLVLVFEKDLGSSLLFFGVFLVMLYAATGRPAYIVVGLLLFAVGAGGAYVAFGHVQARVDIWLHPFADAAGRGYQLVQSLFALAAGGVTGTGLGKGLPGRIPFVTTDFVFAAVGEELGLLGGAGLIAAYLVFSLRGFATAVRARSDMTSLTSIGLVAAFALQTFVIVGGVTRLIPLTGITLPFVSYGGSSILANFMLLALLMRAGDEAAEEDALDSALGPSAAPAAAGSASAASLGRAGLASRVSAVALGVSALLLALVVNLTWIQFGQARALNNNPANSRWLAEELRRDRGTIVTSDGVVLAESTRRSDGTYRRRYPQGPFAAHAVGYFSARYGQTGLEAAEQDTLSGRRVFADLRDVLDAAAGVPVPGNDVVLTLDSRVQRAAESALSGRRGAVVALEPKTGRVLALASSPEYDPGQVDRRWRQLNAAGGAAPLVNRATRSLYPPGSTFKVVTLTAALAGDVATPATRFKGPASMRIGGAPVTNYEGGSYGSIDLRRALASSVNTVFAQLAVRVGADALVRQSQAFGFGNEPPMELPVKASLMPEPGQMTTWETAWAGVGQPVGEHESPAGPQVTAMQMALVAGGIANGGLVMRPYLVDRVADRTGTVLNRTLPRQWQAATDRQTAETVRDLMVNVVESGSGRRAAVRGVTVAGKTGTAEAGKSQPTHAWFIAFAPAENPTVAVAVMLEHAGVGGIVAAPAAKPVLEAALRR